MDFGYYNGVEQEELISSGKLFKINEVDAWRISANNLSEVKVVLGENGFYETVAIDNEGNLIHIIL